MSQSDFDTLVFLYIKPFRKAIFLRLLLEKEYFCIQNLLEKQYFCCPTFRVSQLFHQGFSCHLLLSQILRLHALPFETLSTERCFRTPEFTLLTWTTVLRMCLTEIPGVSGGMGRRPIRETRLIGIPHRVEPAYSSAQETSRWHSATRHVHYRIALLSLYYSKEDSPGP